MGVVDESVYAIMEDNTKIVEGFFPKRENRVSTNYSFPELYLDGGDKGPSTVKVRTDFRDTAYWNPTVTTGATGVAPTPGETVTIAVLLMVVPGAAEPEMVAL